MLLAALIQNIIKTVSRGFGSQLIKAFIGGIIYLFRQNKGTFDTMTLYPKKTENNVVDLLLSFCNAILRVAAICIWCQHGKLLPTSVIFLVIIGDPICGVNPTFVCLIYQSSTHTPSPVRLLEEF